MGLQHRIETKAGYKSKIKGDPIKLLETIKENSLSFNDKKKADIAIIDAIMNLMTTRQRDNGYLTESTKHFKAARDLCKEKYGGIFKIPMLTQKESTWGSDPETSYKTAYGETKVALPNPLSSPYTSFYIGEGTSSWIIVSIQVSMIGWLSQRLVLITGDNISSNLKIDLLRLFFLDLPFLLHLCLKAHQIKHL